MTTTNRTEDTRYATLVSISPEWAKLIYKGRMSSLVMPHSIPAPKTKSQRIFFCESGKKLITGMATCRASFYDSAFQDFFWATCLSRKEIREFVQKRRKAFFHKLEDVQKFKKPVPLSEIGFTQEPQSWSYLPFEKVCIAEPIPF